MIVLVQNSFCFVMVLWCRGYILSFYVNNVGLITLVQFGLETLGKFLKCYSLPFAKLLFKIMHSKEKHTKM